VKRRTASGSRPAPLSSFIYHLPVSSRQAQADPILRSSGSRLNFEHPCPPKLSFHIAMKRDQSESAVDESTLRQSAGENHADADGQMESLVRMVSVDSLVRMVAGVAHELKNPLGILLMGIEYFAKKVDPEDSTSAAVMADMRRASRWSASGRVSTKPSKPRYASWSRNCRDAASRCRWISRIACRRCSWTGRASNKPSFTCCTMRSRRCRTAEASPFAPLKTK